VTAHEQLLSPAEFYACWEALGLGEPPPLLELRSPGRTVAERDRLLAEALDALRARGLVRGPRPHPSLGNTLGILAKPDYQLDMRLSAGPASAEEPLLGLGAVAGADGVLVVSQRGRLRLRSLDGARVAAALIELVGPMTPGPGRPVNIPADLLDRACSSVRDGDLWALADWLIASGIPRIDATSLARMCEGIQLAGQLGLTSWLGREQRAPWVVGFHRTAAGHFMQLRRPSPAAGHTVTVCPTDAERLRYRWRELLDQLYPAA
jgi:hypothetical protein